MRIVAVLNQKGGVGKTTTTVNLGAALAMRGRRVLLIDSDAQGNMSDHLGIDPMSAEKSIYDVLTDDMPLMEAIRPTATENLSVVPSHPDVAAAEQELAGEIGRELRLRRAMSAIPDDTFDWVLIDCPPSLGLLSLNAMAAAGELLITVQTEYFAMRGLGQLDQIVQMVREHVNTDLRILGILPTLVNPVTKLAREVIAEMSNHYGDLVFKTRIRQNVRLAEAPGYGSHIFDYEPLSAGAEDYAALADEIEAMPVVPSTPLEKSAPSAEVVTEPEAVDPEAPDAREPEVPKPEVPKPEVSKPDVPTPDVSTPPTPDASNTDAAGPHSNGHAAPASPPVVPAPSPEPPKPSETRPPESPSQQPPSARGSSTTPPRADESRGEGTSTWSTGNSGRIIMPPPRM